jgi:hypothetical protein
MAINTIAAGSGATTSDAKGGVHSGGTIPPPRLGTGALLHVSKLGFVPGTFVGCCGPPNELIEERKTSLPGDPTDSEPIAPVDVTRFSPVLLYGARAASKEFVLEVVLAHAEKPPARQGQGDALAEELAAAGRAAKIVAATRNEFRSRFFMAIPGSWVYMTARPSGGPRRPGFELRRDLPHLVREPDGFDITED